MQNSLFLLVLIITPCFYALDSRYSSGSLHSRNPERELEVLKDSSTGNMLLALAQLHLQTEGPVDDLISAITALYEDLEEKIDSENDNWSVTNGLHDQRVDELQSNINYADSDIKTAYQKLENVLNPLKEQIESEIYSLNERMDSNRESSSESQEQRLQETEEYNGKVEEHQDCITACEEAITLVNELINSSPSLIQIRKTKNAVTTIQNKLGKNNQYSPLIKALTQLAIDQNFSDQETVQKIADLLKNLRENLENSLEKLKYAEENAQKDYEEIMNQYSQELAELQATLDQRNLDLQSTESNKNS